MKSTSWLIVVRKMLICFAPVIILSLSCTDSSTTRTCSDPLGSEDISISRCNGSDNWAECYFCFDGKEINGTDTCYFNKCFKLYADSPTSDWIIWSWYFTGGCVYGTIADLGSVSCLGDVNSKPTDGYVYSVTPKINHGYVVRFPDNTYGRFFVQKIAKNNLGHDTTVYMTRQYPF